MSLFLKDIMRGPPPPPPPLPARQMSSSPTPHAPSAYGAWETRMVSLDPAVAAYPPSPAADSDSESGAAKTAPLPLPRNASLAVAGAVRAAAHALRELRRHERHAFGLGIVVRSDAALALSVHIVAVANALESELASCVKEGDENVRMGAHRALASVAAAIALVLEDAAREWANLGSGGLGSDGDTLTGGRLALDKVDDRLRNAATDGDCASVAVDVTGLSVESGGAVRELFGALEFRARLLYVDLMISRSTGVPHAPGRPTLAKALERLRALGGVIGNLDTQRLPDVLHSSLSEGRDDLGPSDRQLLIDMCSDADEIMGIRAPLRRGRRGAAQNEPDDLATSAVIGGLCCCLLRMLCCVVGVCAMAN